MRAPYRMYDPFTEREHWWWEWLDGLGIHHEGRGFRWTMWVAGALFGLVGLDLCHRYQIPSGMVLSVFLRRRNTTP